MPGFCVERVRESEPLFCFVMNSQPCACFLGLFFWDRNRPNQAPLQSVGRWGSRAPPSPTPCLPERETCSSVFSTFQNTAATQQSALNSQVPQWRRLSPSLCVSLSFPVRLSLFVAPSFYMSLILSFCLCLALRGDEDSVFVDVF